MEKLKLLAIDIGNSRISTLCFESAKNFERIDFPTGESSIEPVSKLINSANCTYVSSVVPRISDLLFIENRNSNLRQLTYKDIPLKYRIKNIESTGIDRIVNSYAAIKEYNNEVIVIGMGTATIIDAVNRDYEYLGGMILPGVSTMLNSLRTSTAKLPSIDFSPTNALIGEDTASAITLGIQHATIGGIKESVDKLKKIVHSPTIVVTGGWSKVFGPLLPIDCEINYDLTLMGILNLALLHESSTMLNFTAKM